MEEVIAKYPNTPFILAHFYFVSDNYEKACSLFENNPNIYFDLCPGGEMFLNFSKEPQKWKDFFIRYRHRLIMGSDHYAAGYGVNRYNLARNFLEGTEPMVYMDEPVIPINLPTDVLEDIYYKNIKRLIGKEPKPINRKLAYDHCCYIRDNFMEQLTETQKQNLEIITEHFKD